MNLKSCHLCLIPISLILIMLTSCGSEPETHVPNQPVNPEEVFKATLTEVRQLLSQGQVDDAIQSLETFAHENPSLLPVAYANIASIQVEATGPEEALATIKRGLEAAPNSELLLLFQGKILLQSQKLENAILSFQKAVQFHPDSVDAHYQLGQSLLIAQQIIPAASEFRTVVDLNPKHGLAQYQLSRLLNQLGKTKESFDAARTATLLMPDQLEIHRFYQDLAIRHGRRVEISEYYLDLTLKNPKNAMFHYLYGRVLDDPEAAEFRFQLASDIDPSAFWPQYALGVQAFLRRDFTQAREKMKKSLNCKNPDSLRTTLYLCLISIAEKDYATAESIARQLLEKSPGDLRVYALMHQALLEQQQYEKADRLSDEIEALGTKLSIPSTFLRMEAAVQQGNSGLFDDLKSRLRPPLQARDRETLLLLEARMKMQSSDFAAATDILTSASPASLLKSPRSRFLMGWLQQNKGQQEYIETFKNLAANRNLYLMDEDNLYASAAAWFCGEISDQDFYKSERYIRYDLINDYWAIRGMKSQLDGNLQDAQEDYKQSLEKSRGKEFPARLVENLLENNQ